MISERLRIAVKLADVPHYQLARQIGIPRSTFSCIVNRILCVERGDARVVQIGALFGIPARACFAVRPARRAGPSGRVVAAHAGRREKART